MTRILSIFASVWLISSLVIYGWSAWMAWKLATKVVLIFTFILPPFAQMYWMWVEYTKHGWVSPYLIACYVWIGTLFFIGGCGKLAK